MSDSTPLSGTSKTHERHLSDAGLNRVIRIVTVVLAINLAILMLAGVISYTDVDLTPLFPFYQAFAMYVLLPVWAVAIIALTEKGKRRWDAKDKQKREKQAELKKIFAEERKKDDEFFASLSTDEKLVYLRAYMKERR